MQIRELKEYQKKQHPVLSLDCDTPLGQAIREMSLHEYGAIVCTQDGFYHGIFTARLLLKKLAANQNIDTLSLRDVARTDGPVARLEDSAQDKLEEMRAAHVHYMPVVDARGHCIGMISQGDFAAYTLEEAATRFAEALKEKAEDRTNPPGMVIMMGVYAVVVLIAIAVIFY